MWIRVTVICLVWFLASAVHAELYVGGHVGGQIANDFGDIEGTGGAAGTQLTDIDLRKWAVFGGKAGYYIDKLPFVGFEVSSSYAKPNFQAQTVTLSGPGGAAPLLLPETSVRVVTVAFNVVIRAQIKQLEPYAGAGFGLFFARAKNDTTGFVDSDNAAPGIHALVGYRYFFTKAKNGNIYVEYTYDRATLTFANGIAPGAGFEGVYEAHSMMAGLGYNF